MSYREVTGDLFDLGLPAIGHGCNCRGSMRGGIARDFRARWPDMYEEYRRRCESREFRLGGFFRWDAVDVVVYNLATQQSGGADAQLDAVESSLRGALADAASLGLTALGVPKLGAGIGGLAWRDVRAVLREAGEASPVELVAVLKE
ncbi:MAG: macro domain-containing protein [Actinomycetota bacterium]|jgi:O-acetyl-ADP-ribose deacetylase (regulator of RNase III)|nr:macro domain-containing protein [Actinomycetota bacterium]